MYLIIVGLGGIGKNLVKIATKEKNDVVVIDQDEKRCREIAAQYDVLTILGDATERSTLVQADASKADALIATTSDDAANLMMALTAKGMGTKKTVAVVNQEEHVEMFKEAGIFMYENPDMTVASHLYFSVKRPRIKDFLPVSGGKAEIFEVIVSDKSKVVGKKISKLRIKEGIIVAIERDGDIILPKGDTVIKAHDLVTIFAKTKNVERISSIFAP
ncbi:MAG: NAD-binding protein [Methanophagales archaeon]|nr:NAD-binding protein [Methanophagales archaeon]RLG36086.1 MAG: potassium transporter [Methanosarcinales archaeon]MCW3136902.1 NAD-binding protein [Methanophagales archaeon]MCW3139176.1 NAD-binding protein [Methanophagales archaeon]MCW7070401.1 NAD-binding protein [Methanophagales archaeon]